jgi:transketolase
MHGDQIKAIHKKFEAFGFETITIDGHNIDNIVNALNKFRNTNGKPKVIVANTEKGKYFSEEIEGKLNWHGKALGSSA